MILIRKTKILLASIIFLLCLAPVAPAAAQVYNPFQKACQSGAAASSPACQADGSDPITGRNGILYRASRILAMIAAIAAVIMIIVGGFMYITSSGDTSRAENGKRAIIGAVVGLVVIGVAELFIVVVINLVS